MPSKKEVLDSLTKTSYGLAEVRDLIHSVKNVPESSKIKPKTIAKGDVFTHQIGVKSRPCVVYKVRSGLAYAIPMTTTDNVMVIRQSKLSRFFREDIEQSFFSKGVIVVPCELVKENYAFHYEHRREIDLAVKELRKLI